MSQRTNYENGRGCLGVVAIFILVLTVGGCAANYCPATDTQLDTLETIGASK